MEVIQINVRVMNRAIRLRLFPVQHQMGCRVADVLKPGEAHLVQDVFHQVRAAVYFGRHGGDQPGGDGQGEA